METARVRFSKPTWPDVCHPVFVIVKGAKEHGVCVNRVQGGIFGSKGEEIR